MRSIAPRLGLLLAALGLGAGCLDVVIPLHAASSTTEGSGSEVGGVPIYSYDLGYVYGHDPVTDGGTPLRYAQIQATLDGLGCTTSMCHGGTQVPVLVPTPSSNVALLNYYDLVSGCANGTPDPSNCFDAKNPDTSILLTKTCATSNVTHMGGKPFKDTNDPTYQLWRGWIAADAPY
jgi:hypothetical protein